MAALDDLIAELERSYTETRDRLSDPAVYNAHHEKVTFTLPSQEYGVEWQMHLDTAEPDTDQTQTFQPTAKLSAEPRSVVVLHCPRAAGE